MLIGSAGHRSGGQSGDNVVMDVLRTINLEGNNTGEGELLRHTYLIELDPGHVLLPPLNH